MDNINFNLNISKYVSNGWKIDAEVISDKETIYHLKKDLGFFKKIGDLLKRVFSHIGIFNRPESRLDKIKVFNKFEINKFWSGKRIIIIKSSLKADEKQENVSVNEGKLQESIKTLETEVREEVSENRGIVQQDIADMKQEDVKQENISASEEELQESIKTLETEVREEVSENRGIVQQEIVDEKQENVSVSEEKLQEEPLEDKNFDEKVSIEIDESEADDKTQNTIPALTQSQVERTLSEIDDILNLGFSYASLRSYNASIESSTENRFNFLADSSKDVSSSDSTASSGEVAYISSGDEMPPIDTSEFFQNSAPMRQISDTVEQAASKILTPIPLSLPRFFLESQTEISEDWIVRNPVEKYNGKNPNKTDATSALNENLRLAEEQQKSNENDLPDNPDARMHGYRKFLRDQFENQFQMVKIGKTSQKIEIQTDQNSSGKSVFELKHFVYGVSSTQGLRKTMEDAHVAFELDGHPCFAVFDGHNGADDAKYCAENFQRSLEQYLVKHNTHLADLNDAELILFFKKGFVLFDKEVKALENRKPQGTTVAMNIIIDNRNICINLGDSRTVMVNGKNNEDDYPSVKQISIDAKCNHPKYKKKIDQKGGYVDNNNRVYNSKPNTWNPQPGLGMARDIGGVGIKAVSPIPTLSQITMGKYMIIACDGLWDVIESTEAGELLIEMEKKGYDVDHMSQTLVKIALNKGSKDNITAMVIKNTL